MSIFTLFNDPFTTSFEDSSYPSLFDDVFATHGRALQRAPSRSRNAQREIESSNGSSAVSRTFRPRLDVHEGPDVITATFELPGLNREDVSIEVHNNRLTVSGQVSSASETVSENKPKPSEGVEGQQESQQESTQPQSGTWHIRERRFGKFSRTIYFPDGVNADQIKASHADGVLTLTFPKAVPEQERKKIAIA